MKEHITGTHPRTRRLYSPSEKALALMDIDTMGLLAAAEKHGLPHWGSRNIAAFLAIIPFII